MASLPVGSSTQAAAAEPDASRKTEATTRFSTAYVATFAALAVATLIAAFGDKGDGFLPRVPTIDALAGLTAAAFLVDRLLTFVPPFGLVDKKPAQRAADLDVLRLGFGAIIAALFVAVTGLEAVQALTSTEGVNDRLDRVITMLALAGGAKGLARVTQALNPPKDTDGSRDGGDEGRDSPAMGPPARWAYWVGVALLAVGLAIAFLSARHDKTGLELLRSDLSEGGTTAAIVRFGVLILAAGVIQQLIEVLLPKSLLGDPNRTIVTGGVAVLLGVIAARLLDVYLLHNLGFFGTTARESVSTALAASSSTERWGDAFVTGVVIAAGTKPIHDLASKLQAVKESR
jgi:hypothetical protein